MKSQHPTDEFVRRKLAEQPPEFNEAHWEEALAMLATQGKPSRFGWLRRRWALLLAILLISSVSFFAINLSQKSGEQAVEQSSNQTTKQSNNQAINHNNHTDQRATKQSNNQTTKHSNNQAINHNNHTDQRAINQSNIQTTEQSNNQAIDHNNHTDQRAINQSEKTFAVKDEELKRLSSFTDNPIHWVIEDGARELENLDYLFTDIVVDPLPNPTFKVFPYHQVAAYRRHHLGVTTGLGIAKGLGVEQGNGIAPAMGLHYAYNLRPRIRLETGLGYTIRNGLGGARTFQSVRYGFGRELEESTLDFRQRHMLTIPINISWQPRGNHSFLIGTSLARQLNVHGELTTVVTDPFGKQTSTVIRQGGYRQAYRPMDVSLQAGYGYRVNKNFALRLIGQYGLTDLTPDDFWEEVRMDRNVQLRLQLTYHLFHW